MKFTVWIATYKVGSTCETEVEVPDEDLEGLEPGSYEYEDVVEEYAKDDAFQMMQWGWRPLEE